MRGHHIANGMYGLILVEPEGGLPPVDREFYVMQGEIYTEAPFGHRGSQEFSVEKSLNERPEYFVFNGAVGALSKLHPLEAKVGETIRIFFSVGGPNYTSTFYVIGKIFARLQSWWRPERPLARCADCHGSGGRRRPSRVHPIGNFRRQSRARRRPLTRGPIEICTEGLVRRCYDGNEDASHIQTVLICGWSCRTAFNSELWTSMPPL